MKSFLVSLFWVVGAAIGAAVLVTLVPLAHVAAGVGVLLIAIVFSASRSGAPSLFGVRHLIGAFFAVAAIVAHWGALVGLADAAGQGVSGLAAFDFQAVLTALRDPMNWPQTLQNLAGGTSYATGGVVVTGDTLATAWWVEAALLALFGVLGGQAARWRQRSRL